MFGFHQIKQQISHYFAGGRIQVARGFVGQDDGRIVYQGAGDGHALTLATAVTALFSHLYPNVMPSSIDEAFSPRQMAAKEIQSLIEKGIAEGARLVAGGPGRPEGFNKGFFVRPTVFADVTNDMAIAREEIFGPVTCMIPYKDMDEAIAIAVEILEGRRRGVV